MLLRVGCCCMVVFVVRCMLSCVCGVVLFVVACGVYGGVLRVVAVRC